MSNFDKMIKLIEEKDIKVMEEWLHSDFLFVEDYEMETREEWLKETQRLFEEEDYNYIYFSCFVYNPASQGSVYP